MRAIIVMAAALSAFPAQAEGPAEDCGPKQVASLDIVMPANQAFVLVPVEIGGREVYFEVDTGASVSVVSRALADDLHLAVRNAVFGNAYNVAGQSLREKAMVLAFKLGGVDSQAFDFFVAPDTVTDPPGSPLHAAGLLGMDILSQFDIELDVAHRKMNLYTHAHCPGQAAYWSTAHADLPIDVGLGRHIILPMTINGKPGHALLDTGSQYSTMRAEWAEDNFGLKPGATGVEPSGVAAFGGRQSLPVYRHRFKNLEFKSREVGGVQFNNPPVDLIAVKGPMRDARPDEKWDMLLGMKELRLLHIFIAYDERVLYVTTANSHAQ